MHDGSNESSQSILWFRNKKKGLMEWEQKVMVMVSQLPSGRWGSSGERQFISWAHMSKVEATPLLVLPYPSLV